MYPSTKPIRKSEKLHAHISFGTNEKDKDLKGIIIDKLKSMLCNYKCP